MSEVLTRVDPDDSVQKLTMDYKIIALAFQDVIAAYELPITISIQSAKSALEHEVLEAVKVAFIDGLILSTTLNDAVKALVEFEAKEETKVT